MPFIGGILTKGEIPLRSLLGIPIILSGWALLGLTNHSSIYKSLVALLTVLCVFQFVSSSNHLFAASHLALEEDRLLGSRIIEKIGDAQSKSNSGNIHYLEMVGYLERPSTLLIPQIDTVGASFFGWDEGDSYRALDFLQTLGYYGLEPLPLDQRYSVVEFANSMANWPNPGSVKVTGDIVVVKFGPYSKIQISEICLSEKNRTQLQGLNFCP